MNLNDIKSHLELCLVLPGVLFSQHSKTKFKTPGLQLAPPPLRFLTGPHAGVGAWNSCTAPWDK